MNNSTVYATVKFIFPCDEENKQNNGEIFRWRASGRIMFVFERKAQ